MAVATLTIDLAAMVENWRALDAKSAPQVETAAVVKANGYGLGTAVVARTLAKAGADSFFVAAAEEGITLRQAIPTNAKIYVFSGCCPGDAEILKTYNLIPLLNSPQQVANYLPCGAPFGIQLDTGMNRLGLEPDEFAALKDQITTAGPQLIISHLACADEPGHPQNQQQLSAFHAMTNGLRARKSLAATGGTLLGADYHFDLTRPGVGLYGGKPFSTAKPVVNVSIPIIQTRTVATGESVGYGAHWRAKRPSIIATIAAGYADGLVRAMGNTPVNLYADETPCPMVGRISMDMIAVDLSNLDHTPTHLEILNKHQTIDDLADAAGTIGYEILTSLGDRYKRVYVG